MKLAPMTIAPRRAALFAAVLLSLGLADRKSVV